jgi:hypothetical protein
VRDVDAQLIVASQAAPPHGPAEGALDYPAAGLDGKSLLPLELAYDLDRKIHAPRLVHECLAIMGGIAKQVLGSLISINV